jgi:hypothetical protein
MANDPIGASAPSCTAFLAAARGPAAQRPLAQRFGLFVPRSCYPRSNQLGKSVDEGIFVAAHRAPEWLKWTEWRTSKCRYSFPVGASVCQNEVRIHRILSFEGFLDLRSGAEGATNLNGTDG